MNILKEIKKREWLYLVNRHEAPLMSSITENSKKYFHKTTKINKPLEHNFRLADGDIYNDKKSWHELENYFIKRGAQSLLSYRKNLIHYVNKFNKLSIKIGKTDCAKLDKKELARLYNDYMISALCAHNFLSSLVIVDGTLVKMILNLLPKAEEAKQKEWLRILTFPLKENEHTKEERGFYKLADARKNNKNIDKLIEKHLKRYAYIGARWYWWDNEWKVKDIKERLDNFFILKKNPMKELKHLDNIRKERAEKMNKLLRVLNIKKNSKLYKLIMLAKEFAFLRTWRTDIIYQASYLAKNMFYEIADRSGIKRKDIVYFTCFEILSIAKTQKSPISSKEIKVRKKYFNAVHISGKYFVLPGKNWYEKLKKVIGKTEERAEVIRGNTAYKGKASGRVVVVKTNEDIKKVQRGDVLVAVMTFPNFIPAMEKAIAFVTDEGGILCHAAIVSREMRKPCIIATKNATKVLRDGDLVEVDADKGIIKVLKKKKSRT